MDSRILGIVGGVLVLLGIFLPLVTVTIGQAGMSQSVSFLDSIKGGSWEGWVLLLLGIGSIVLAVLRQYRFLIVTGVITLGIVVLNYINMKSSLAKAMGSADPEMLERMGVDVSTNWLGWLVLGLGALILLAAGATGKNAPAPAAWGSAPPPPPPYTPGR
ncbi:MAG TPA: hypothetical protein VN256_19890 [Pyrinomonadaceae bacterium]|nr:hypothetical protein [Pyrinomonadaceae bacterium]